MGALSADERGRPAAQLASRVFRAGLLLGHKHCLVTGVRNRPDGTTNHVDSSTHDRMLVRLVSPQSHEPQSRAAFV